LEMRGEGWKASPERLCLASLSARRSPRPEALVVVELEAFPERGSAPHLAEVCAPDPTPAPLGPSAAAAAAGGEGEGGGELAQRPLTQRLLGELLVLDGLRQVEEVDLLLLLRLWLFWGWFRCEQNAERTGASRAPSAAVDVVVVGVVAAAPPQRASKAPLSSSADQAPA